MKDLSYSEAMISEESRKNYLRAIYAREKSWRCFKNSGQSARHLRDGKLIPILIYDCGSIFFMGIDKTRNASNKNELTAENSRYEDISDDNH